MNLKKNLGYDLECQVLEDALWSGDAAVSLGDLMDRLSRKDCQIRKRLEKMSLAARERPFGLSLYSDRERELI